MQCVTLLLILVDTGLKELYLPLLVTGIHCTKLWVWKHICQYQWSWDKPYSPGCNHLCPMLQFGSKHVCIEDVHIFKHCYEMTLFLLWIGTYCISCVVQQTSGVKDLSSLVRYDDSSLAAIRYVQSTIPVVRRRPNIRSHSVLFSIQWAITNKVTQIILSLWKDAPVLSVFFIFLFFEGRRRLYTGYLWVGDVNIVPVYNRINYFCLFFF